MHSPLKFYLFGCSIIYGLIEVTDFEELAKIFIGYEITLFDMLVSISNQAEHVAFVNYGKPRENHILKTKLACTPLGLIIDHIICCTTCLVS